MQDAPSVCQNCETPLEGEFCARCGQRRTLLRQPVTHFVRESFVDFFSIDGRLWRSLGTLVVRPGHLTQAYLAGRRVRYLTPLRLYLISSLLFFFLLTLIDPADRLGQLAGEEASPDSVTSVSACRAEVAARLAANRARLAQLESAVDSSTQAAAAAPERDAGGEPSARVPGPARLTISTSSGDGPEVPSAALEAEIERDEWLSGQLAEAPSDSTVRVMNYERAAELIATAQPQSGVTVDVQLPEWWPQTETVGRLRTARTSGDVIAAGVDLLRESINRLPTVMFLLLPLFALLLKIVYLRRGWYYSEHLVFGLHTHAFAFLVFTVVLLATWGDTGWARIAIAVASVVIPIYFLLAQKKVYGQGWLRTIGKAFVVGWAYSFFLSIGAVAAILLAL